MRKILYIFGWMLAMACNCAWSAAALAASQESIVVGPASITYQTRAGDTLLTIAQQLTTKSGNWVALAKLNHISQDSNIPIGTPILIPADLLTDEPSEAQVVALSGIVTATTVDGKPVEIRIGAKLVEGVQIETGANGFLTMSLPDASRISLPSNSRVRFSRLRMARFTKSPRTELLLMHGHVESRVSPLNINLGSYEVRTPTSVAGVRGTQFRVGVDGNTVTNEVIAGKVVVAKAGQSAELTLEGGTGNVIDTKSVGPAVALLPPPGFVSLTSDPSAQIRVTPIAGAIAYHVQIASDPDAQDVLAETRSSDVRIKVDGLADGSYYARVTAIDKQGLEGFSRIQPIVFNAHGNTQAGAVLPNSPYVEGSDDKQVNLRWHASAAKEYIVQVARDAQFTWLIFNGNTAKPEIRFPRPAFGTYYARVQAINADGTTTPFSAPQALIVTDHWVINEGGPANSKRNTSSGSH